ncbi:hypothetical protein E3N88_10534 [Mikania micrantha]|uniref:Uncharacterized protein n=1 Tax=Mikania micrantha TaxID=192012 RepID=A0A5N6PB39_9ASTR|nr:hypothetical protein E3N88_10534 [Mikania micrantha]
MGEAKTIGGGGPLFTKEGTSRIDDEEKIEASGYKIEKNALFNEASAGVHYFNLGLGVFPLVSQTLLVDEGMISDSYWSSALEKVVPDQEEAFLLLPAQSRFH